VSNIVFEHITKRYGDGFEAVKEMNLNVDDGEFAHRDLAPATAAGNDDALRDSRSGRGDDARRPDRRDAT
jgi:hypothetical protein